MIATLTQTYRNMNGQPSTLTIYLVLYYATFFYFTIWGNPENEVSIGIHEEIGPCNITVPSFGTVSRY